MADFLTTLAKRTLNLIQVVQPAISSMFAPASTIAADFSFHSTPAFEPPEVGENLEERPDSLTQHTAPLFSLLNPVQMKSALSANRLTAPSHLSLLSSELGLPTHPGTEESIAQNTPSVSDLREEIGVSSAAAPRTQLEAISLTQPSEESALTLGKPLVNSIEEQEQPTDGREKAKGEGQKGENLMPSPLEHHTNKILSTQAGQNIEAATSNLQQSPVSGATHPQGNPVQQMLPSADLAESQAPLHSLNLIQVVQPAISSMFAPASTIAADFSFHSTPAFEPPEVGENLEERPDSLTQHTAPLFSLLNPVHRTTRLKQQAENRELAPRSSAKVENSNTENQPFPMSDRHLLNAVEKLVSETPFEINSLVHRVDADELALVRRLLGSAVLVPDTRFKLSRAEEQNLLHQQQLRYTEMRSSNSRRLEPRNGREAAVAAKDSTPTIQVTIGRIDVRASKSPEVSRTRTVRSRPALSLDDYLKQRNGRDG